MDYNPYNRNKISQDELLQKKKEKLNETNNWILGHSLRNSFTKNNNNNIYNNLYMGNNKNFLENRKDNNLLIHSSNIISNNNIINNNYNQLPNNNYQQNNFPYLIYIPVSIPSFPQYNPSLSYNPNFISTFNSQQIFNPTTINSQLNKLNEIEMNDNNNDYSIFGLESKRKEKEKFIKIEEYRKELLKQIEEKKRADEERKKKMKEEEKNELKKNEEYFKLKKKQEDEENKKLREKITRRMQRQQMDEFNNSSNILEISKDFENMNKSRQGTSLVNNIDTKHKNSLETGYRENVVNLEEYYQNDNIYDIINNNMIEEEENYLKEIDDEYNELCQSIKLDIDEMINKNKTDIYLEIPYYNEKLKKKEKQYANYILGKTVSPPTPIKLNEKDLSLMDNRKTENIKKMNLDDFFNQDIKKEKYSNKNNNIKFREAKVNIDKEYFEIFENLQEIKLYTKKYSSNKNFENYSESFMSNQTHLTDESLNKKINETKNKFDLQSYYNSTISNSLYEKEINKNENEKDEENVIKVEDSSMRTTENKNKSKTILDKQLINIKENKEDEEDEEDDEENKKIKEVKNNNENKVNTNERDKNINLNENVNKKGNNLNEKEKDGGEEKEEKEEKEEGEEEEEDDENNEVNEDKKE